MKYKAKNDKEYNEHVKSEHISILHKNNKTRRNYIKNVTTYKKE